MKIPKKYGLCVCSSLCLAYLMACSPTVRIEAPEKPIVINLNVKVEQQVQVKVEKDVTDLFQNKPGIF